MGISRHCLHLINGTRTQHKDVMHSNFARLKKTVKQNACMIVYMVSLEPRFLGRIIRWSDSSLEKQQPCVYLFCDIMFIPFGFHYKHYAKTLTFFKHLDWHCAFNIPSCISIFPRTGTDMMNNVNVINDTNTNKDISLQFMWVFPVSQI